MPWISAVGVASGATVFETSSGSLLNEDGSIFETTFQSSPGSAMRAINVPTLTSLESSPSYSDIIQGI